VTARLAAQCGELAEALSLARGAVELTEQTDWSNPATPAWLALAEVLRQDDEVAEADAAVAAAVRICEEKGNVAAIAGLRAGARSPRQTPA